MEIIVEEDLKKRLLDDETIYKRKKTCSSTLSSSETVSASNDPCDVLSDRYLGQNRFANLNRSKLSWDDLNKIKTLMCGNENQFIIEMKKLLVRFNMNDSISSEFSNYISNIIFSPKVISVEAQQLIECVRRMDPERNIYNSFTRLVELCDKDLMIRSIVDTKFNPFQVATNNISILSRSSQVCNVFKLMQDRSEVYADASDNFPLNNSICLIDGVGSGKTFFLNCLVHWTDYKEEIIKSLKSWSNRCRILIDMVYDADMVTCGATFGKLCAASVDEIRILNVEERVWLRVLFQEICKADSNFNSFRLLFLQDINLKCILCYEFIISMFRSRNHCHHVMLLIDELLSCQGNVDLESRISNATKIFSTVGNHLFYDREMTLVSTSLCYSPVDRFFYPPHNTVYNIKLPNMKDISNSILHGVHEASNGIISCSDALMLASSVTFHPRAIEQLLIFANLYTSSNNEDLLVCFSNHISRCEELSWYCNAVAKLIYPSIFLRSIYFAKGEFCGMDQYILNNARHNAIIPFLSPIHLFQCDDLKPLVRQGLNNSQPKWFDIFVANWICTRFNMYVASESYQSKYIFSAFLGFGNFNAHTYRLSGRNMTVHKVSTMNDLKSLDPAELCYKVYVSETTGDEGIELIAFFPMGDSDKMLIIGTANKLNMKNYTDMSVPTRDVLETVIKSSKTLSHWDEQGHYVHLWIPFWINMDDDIKDCLSRTSSSWQCIETDITISEMMQPFIDYNIPMTTISHNAANFAGRLGCRTIISDRRKLRRGIFGPSISWFVERGRLNHHEDLSIHRLGYTCNDYWEELHDYETVLGDI